jgi:hypothetical protein
MSEYDNDHLCSLRAALLDHPLYAQFASVADLRRFVEDHAFAVWDFNVTAEAIAAGHDLYRSAVVPG